MTTDKTREDELKEGIEFSMHKIEHYKELEEDCTNYIREELAKIEVFQAELKGIAEGRRLQKIEEEKLK